jgi:hypothetical protein
MPELPPGFAGDRLTLDEYIDDYYSRFWRTDRSGCWKLERQQTFREQGNASWDASDDGDWARAKALLDEDRENVREYQQKILDHGFEFRRVRIVEKPYSPYLIWELNSLLIRHEYGERIRIAATESIRQFEKDGELPEIVVIGTEVAYQVEYDYSGLAVGAVRSTHPGTVRSWTDLIRRLHEQGEDLPRFFAREIAGLQPARSV